MTAGTGDIRPDKHGEQAATDVSYTPAEVALSFFVHRLAPTRLVRELTRAKLRLKG